MAQPELPFGDVTIPVLHDVNLVPGLEHARRVNQELALYPNASATLTKAYEQELDEHWVGMHQQMIASGRFLQVPCVLDEKVQFEEDTDLAVADSFHAAMKNVAAKVLDDELFISKGFSVVRDGTVRSGGIEGARSVAMLLLERYVDVVFVSNQERYESTVPVQYFAHIDDVILRYTVPSSEHYTHVANEYFKDYLTQIERVKMQYECLGSRLMALRNVPIESSRYCDEETHEALVAHLYEAMNIRSHHDPFMVAYVDRAKRRYPGETRSRAAIIKDRHDTVRIIGIDVQTKNPKKSEALEVILLLKSLGVDPEVDKPPFYVRLSDIKGLVSVLDLPPELAFDD